MDLLDIYTSNLEEFRGKQEYQQKPVPTQLRNERFIKLKSVRSLYEPSGNETGKELATRIKVNNGDLKEPLQREWESNPERQYSADDIDAWRADVIRSGCGNYGVVPKTVTVIDADNSSQFEELGLFSVLPKTFRVRSGRPALGYHIYLHVKNIDEEQMPRKRNGEFASSRKASLDTADGVNLGDIRFPGGNTFTVGPWSLHPWCRRYVPEDLDCPVASIEFDDLMEIFKDCYHPKKKSSNECAVPDHVRVESDDGIHSYGYTVFDFLSPVHPHARDGNVEGEHPIHGSSTGSNFAVTADGRWWYCRRHETGGGLAKAVAVAKGIIDCSEADRELTSDEIRKVFKVLDRMNPEAARKRKEAYRDRVFLRVLAMNEHACNEEADTDD